MMNTFEAQDGPRERVNVNSVFGHKKGEGTKSFCVYTVYDSRTDFPVIVDGDARECVKAMGIKLSTFFRYMSKKKYGGSLI